MDKCTNDAPKYSTNDEEKINIDYEDEENENTSNKIGELVLNF